MSDRDKELRRQAEAIASQRTAERDALRAAMPMGLAVELLLAQIRRLKRTPCPTMGFDPTRREVGTASIRDELAELEAEEPGTDGHRSEILDLLATVLHLAINAGIGPADIAGQASKLGARLDVIDIGGTWAEAKRKEKAK